MYTFLKDFEVFDIETVVEGEGALRPLAISYSENEKICYKYLTDKDDLLEVITSTFKNGIIYYAHNLLFDFSFIIPYIVKNSIEYNWVFYNKKLYSVTLNCNNKKIEMRCSLNLLPFSLDKLYPDFTSHRKLYFPYEVLQNWDPCIPCINYKLIAEDYKKCTMGEYLEIYSCLDSTILKESLTNLFKLLYKNNLKITEKKSLTLGSITLYNYIKKYNQIKLDLPAKHKTLIRNAYFGGRCEVFGNVRDGEKILHFDFPGLYQQCMLESLPNDSYTLSHENLSIDIPGFYLIEIETKSWLPVLPVRDFRLLFKCGKISGWFWHEEIQTALKYTEYRDFKIKAGLVAAKCEPVLAEYINSLSLIKNQKGLKSKIGKHLINSLYGRFAIKDVVERSEIVSTGAELQQYIPIQNTYSIENITIRRKKKSNIGIAAAIASKGRKKLYEGFLEVLKAGGRLLYCDTDSIYAAFPQNSVVEGKLLEQHVTFGLNERRIVDAVFIAPKMYAVLYEGGVEVIKLKGINNKHSFEDIKHFFYSKNDNHVLDYTTIDKNYKNEYVYENKRLQKNLVHKRLWSDDRKTTEPRYS